MLVIISDLHLGDGTTANSISPSAFHLFANRLREMLVRLRPLAGAIFG